jgi:hypothetical protein
LRVPKPCTQSKKQQNREIGETAFPDQGLGRIGKKGIVIKLIVRNSSRGSRPLMQRKKTVPTFVSN